MRVSLVVGNPKARSRTWEAAHRLADGLGATDVVAHDLVDLGPGLLGWGDPDVSAAVKAVASSDVAIFASPTFKATYTGLLKLFLDQLPGGTGLEGVVGIPLMLGAGPAHQLAAELHLKPVLVEVGATVPAPALYLIDSAPQPDAVEHSWLASWAPVVRAAVGVEA
ncbi:NADPH-dependent FMN reductase [Aeromicrobium sp. 9AM]|uniref:NADPH-dependent FMN reductase n=1 Tax=Aeromicrobium sp. 9AM TaxID=2653126 RepID=UPI0012EF6DED|nr:NAD(P)H-dependent oxidoreductase [Aeromicrobium sp. 9AM]VXB59995.1 NADPH-dependent FMN reductase [Aeromicrobium sp. 9AM]